MLIRSQQGGGQVWKEVNVASVEVEDQSRLHREQERIKNEAKQFTKSAVEEILNLQPKGSKAKFYQVAQIRSLIVKYKLGPEHVE